MFDETTDIARESQLALVLRYVHNGVLREDFLEFISLRRPCAEHSETMNQSVHEPTITNKDLGRTVLAILQRHRLNLKNCVGVGTDGCSTMVSETKGAVAEVQRSASHALRCPCYNHALNLSISRSTELQDIRNAVGVIKEVVAFFTALSKMNEVLKQIFVGQLSGFCETRCVERHESVQQFRSCLPKIVETLDNIAHWRERQSASRAATLLAAVSDSHFVIALVLLNNLLAHTYPLSKVFQSHR
ncbi:hypothetical protein HPB48_003841 [Haemaphysalis longicornis]|uniref:DUF4371 domain-containing protein n=1 Tax=Haemaphysalis longicornis TaxID=44386 RepID=A0A9J6FAX3_HAELO|nr:hypothetical protein HPB48_003841 [Haemaphysalis longicornis]